MPQGPGRNVRFKVTGRVRGCTELQGEGVPRSHLTCSDSVMKVVGQVKLFPGRRQVQRIQFAPPEREQSAWPLLGGG